MPSPISFAFCDAMMASSPAPMDGAAAGAEGAGVFGQLIDAAQVQAVPAQAAPVMAAEMAMASPLTADGASGTFGALANQAASAEQPMMPVAADATAPMVQDDALPEQPAPSPIGLDTAMAGPLNVAEPEAEDIGQNEPPQSLGEPIEFPADPPLNPADESADAAALNPAPQPETPRPAAPVALALQGQPSEQAGHEGSDLAEDAPLQSGQSARANRAAEMPLAAVAALADNIASDDGGSASQSLAQNLSAATPAAVRAEPVESGLSAALLTQTMAPHSNATPANPYPTTMTAAVPSPVVQAKSGQMGADIGTEIAKVLRGDGESLLIRLDPRELGRVDVRLSFDKEGVLRAVMSVDSPVALEMLRRESGDLNRSLSEAGVRSDGQSLRFDARSGEGAGQGAQPWRDARSGQGAGRGGTDQDGRNDDNKAPYRPLRTTSQVDLIA